ncbi:NAD-dependent epimerase/dehydratase family protein [Oscillibacter sp. GMB15532]|uniref:NAD-dependent epimerase/dehydratase family protein n=1 Tax=Oscillibacter sp. GMB15532 TaxID=3230022 RepID=UPI0034DF0612
MKVLVAGGAGFIGSNLIDILLTEGHQVVCVDNYFIGTRENIRHLAENPQFRLYEQDLTDLDALKAVFAEEHFDYVFHMAANSDIQASALSPEVEYRNTYSTTFNVLECMRLYGVKKLFFCSTSAVYGDVQGAEVTELYAPLMPISYYGACKLGCEGLISAFSYMNGFHSLIFRFPNVIGPRLTHGVIFDFVKRLRENPTELTILGDGRQCKPYLYVKDLVDCILRFYEYVPEGVTVYNVGDDTQSTVSDIAQIVCREMGLKDVAFRYTGGVGGWKGDVPVFAYNLEKIHATGWKASMTSDEAVAQTVRAVL